MRSTVHRRGSTRPMISMSVYPEVPSRYAFVCRRWLHSAALCVSRKNALLLALYVCSIPCHCVPQAVSLHGNVSVSSIDGSFDLFAEHGSIKLQVNKLLPFSSRGATEQSGSGSGGDMKSAPLAQVVHAVDADGRNNGDSMPSADPTGPGLHATVEGGLAHRRNHRLECAGDATPADSSAVKFGVEHTVDVAAQRRLGSRAFAPKGHITAIVDPEVSTPGSYHW